MEFRNSKQNTCSNIQKLCSIKAEFFYLSTTIDLLRNNFRREIMIFQRRGDFTSTKYASRLAVKTMKREEVNMEYSLTSGELFAAEKS